MARHGAMRKTPPVAPPTFSDITPARIDEEVDSALAASTALRDQLAATLTPSTATFVNLVQPLLDDVNRAKRRTVIPTVLLSRVSVDPAIRDAAREAQKRVTDAEGANLCRADIVALVAAVYEREKDRAALDHDDRAILIYLHGQLRRSGATILNEVARERLAAAQSEISEINAAALKYFTEEKDEGVWFARAELAGCSEDWLAALKSEQRDGEEVLWVRHDDCRPIWKMSPTGAGWEARKKMYLANERRFPDNVGRIARLVVLRDEVARLLGYEHHAALRMENMMQGTVELLQERLANLHQRLAPLAAVETAALLALKKQLYNESQSGGHDEKKVAGEICPWEKGYYTNIQSKRDYAVDGARVAEYFEINHVVAKMLKVFEELFGMEFVPTPEMDAWHESVSPFAVWDSEVDGGEFLGYLYIDIFKRPGKFSTQYHSRIQQGFYDAGGTRHYPVSALMCSYPESTPEQPSLLAHRDVRILFHELGHALHHLADRTRYGAMNQSHDFGEIPSNMLEHFVYVPDVMVRLSKHYKTLPTWNDGTDVPDCVTIPLDLARAIARTKTLNQASGLLGLMQPAMFDLAIYTPKTHEEAKAMDITAIWNDTERRYIQSKYPEGEVMFGQAGFSPIFRGYDVGYFTYVMSRVYAADLYQAIFAENFLSQEAGRRWRYGVLERGSSQSELGVMERHIGRPLSADAIFEQIVNGQRV